MFKNKFKRAFKTLTFAREWLTGFYQYSLLERSRIVVRDDSRVKVGFSAFTLAEVLVTLGIIGVVAAITIPQIVNYNQQQEAVIGLKKAYSEMSQAVKMAEIDNGPVSGWGFFAGEDNTTSEYKAKVTTFVETYILSYIKTNAVCKIYGYNYNAQACESLYYYIKQNGVSYGIGTHSSGNYSFMTKDNIFYFVTVNSSSGITRAQILLYTDINGPKKPNVWGKDVFLLDIQPKRGLRTYDSGTPKSSLPGNCKNSSRVWCAALIEADGWQITKDYPWAEMK